MKGSLVPKWSDRPLTLHEGPVNNSLVKISCDAGTLAPRLPRPTTIGLTRSMDLSMQRRWQVAVASQKGYQNASCHCPVKLTIVWIEAKQFPLLQDRSWKIHSVDIIIIYVLLVVGRS